MNCERWKTGCGNCPDLDIPFKFRRDTTALNWKIKRAVFKRSALDIVVGSRWQAERVRQSPLLSHLAMHHVPYGVDTRVYKTGDKAAARAILGIPADAHVIAFRSTPYSRNFKGTEYIESALNSFKPRKRTFLVLLEGIGGLNSLRQKFDILELGWIFDQAKIALALQAADIFLMPSIAEAFGLMAIESMACGTPVIVFEGTALPETIDAPRSGIAVPYKDSEALARAIADCLDNPGRLAQLRENGLRHVAAKHSFEAYADGYLALYERLVRERRAA
jgi:glycosyltransferase involved in cell wall biosynthesis